MWSALSRHQNFALLVLRVVLGGMFIMHGFPKIIGGPEKWQKIGSAMDYAGVHSLYGFFGFMAAFSEFFGGIAVVLGVMFRPAALLMATTMTVAALMHLGKGDGVLGAAHAIEVGAVFFALVFIGPGALSLDKK
ncbi:MAG: DoxX family protein [Deltaproteobacteria bacterium]|nr:DoxX family protein [Deltaproteobacteria bacterium]